MAKLDEQVAKDFFDARGARGHLGVTRERWDYLVRLGLITGHDIPGYKKLYKKGDVYNLAAQLEAALLAALMGQTECRVATVEDIEAEVNLARMVFGERAVETQEKRREFLVANPQMTHHLYDAGGVLVASINLLPLDHESILEFRDGKRGWLFPKSAIRQFVPGEPLECIIIDFITTPLVGPAKRSAYAVRLLTCLAETLVVWGRQGIEIASIDACGSTESGRRVLESAGFVFTGHKGGNRYMYHLDIASSTLKLLHDYKEAVAHYKQVGQH